MSHIVIEIPLLLFCPILLFFTYFFSFIKGVVLHVIMIVYDSVLSKSHFWPVYNHDFLNLQTYNLLIDHIFSYRRILGNSYNGNCQKIVRISRIVRVSWPPLYIVFFFENQNIFVLGCSLKFRLHIPFESPGACYQTFFIPDYPIFETQKYSIVPNSSLWLLYNVKSRQLLSDVKTN